MVVVGEITHSPQIATNIWVVLMAKTIDYDNYVAYKPTLDYLRRNYDVATFNKWGDRLAFLYQNGIRLAKSSSEELDTQMSLFNNLNTYEDFDEMLKMFGRSDEPSEVGYEIVNSVLESWLKTCSWAREPSVQPIEIGKIRYSEIVKSLKKIAMLLDSNDYEIEKVVKEKFSEEVYQLVDDCETFSVDRNYLRLVISYEKLWKSLMDIRKSINRSTLQDPAKGLGIRMGNINDEIYGSSGGFEPTTQSIKICVGSAVNDLKTLLDATKTDEQLKNKLLVMAKDCIDDGETDKDLVEFVKGDESRIHNARKALAEITFSGIQVLLELKHGLTIFDGDTLNTERVNRINYELAAICRFVGFKSKELV